MLNREPAGRGIVVHVHANLRLLSPPNGAAQCGRSRCFWGKRRVTTETRRLGEKRSWWERAEGRPGRCAFYAGEPATLPAHGEVRVYEDTGAAGDDAAAGYEPVRDDFW